MLVLYSTAHIRSAMSDERTRKATTSTAPGQDDNDFRALGMSARQAKALHRIVASYNVAAETHASPNARLEPDLETTLLRLAAA